MGKSDKVLFHYTSLEGLLGIIEKKSIWATNILYLNDTTELNYAMSLLEEQLQHFIRKGITHNEWFFRTLLEDIRHSISSTEFPFYVCSFSEEKDILSQWRGYSSKGIGFSLGFKLSYLITNENNKTSMVKPCIYDEQEQITVINKLIEKASSTFTHDNKRPQSQYEMILSKPEMEFFTEFMALAPTFKHPKFREEKEWRIIYRAYHSDKNVKIEFRAGRSMIVPYIAIPLTREGDDLIINKVIVGPTLEPNLSKASVEMLLESKNVKFEEVECSIIPYRHW